MTSKIGRPDAPRTRWFGYKHGPDTSTTRPMEPNDAAEEARARASARARISSLWVCEDEDNAML
jgi:hypothetical protein